MSQGWGKWGDLVPPPPSCPVPHQTLAAPSPGVEPEGKRECQLCGNSILFLVMIFFFFYPPSLPFRLAPTFPMLPEKVLHFLSQALRASSHSSSLSEYMQAQ